MGQALNPKNAELLAVATNALAFLQAIQLAFLGLSNGSALTPKEREDELFEPTLQLADALQTIEGVRSASRDWTPIARDAVEHIKRIHAVAVQTWGWESYVLPSKDRETRIDEQRNQYRETYLVPYYCHALAGERATAFVHVPGVSDDSISYEIRKAAASATDQGFSESPGLVNPVKAFIEAKYRLDNALVFSSQPPMPLSDKDFGVLYKASWRLAVESGLCPPSSGQDQEHVPLTPDQWTEEDRRLLELFPEGQVLIDEVVRKERERGETLSESPECIIWPEKTRAASTTSNLDSVVGNTSPLSPENEEKDPKTDQLATLKDVATNDLLYDELILEKRKARAPQQVALLTFMKSRTEATFEDLARHVHGDEDASDGAIRANVLRTKLALLEKKLPITFRVASSSVFKEVQSL